MGPDALTADEKLRRALAAEVHDGEGYVPFGELGVAEAEAQFERLREATGFGPTMRVRPVADAWRELAKAMSEHGAASVAALEPDQVIAFAEGTWVLPPRGGFLNASD